MSIENLITNSRLFQSFGAAAVNLCSVFPLSLDCLSMHLSSVTPVGNQRFLCKQTANDYEVKQSDNDIKCV